MTHPWPRVQSISQPINLVVIMTSATLPLYCVHKELTSCEHKIMQ